jgi:CubicO group peptidase (beta-lactamase class C family)
MSVDGFKIGAAALLLAFLTACGGGGGGSDQPSTVSVAPLVPPTPSPSPTPVANQGLSRSWPEARAESQGLSEQKLEEAAAAALRDGTFGQAFLVIRNGNIVFERYRGISDLEAQAVGRSNPQLSKSSILEQYGTRDKNSLATSWSVAKSFTSMLFGIAIEQGSISSKQSQVALYLSDWATDDRASITLQEVLDMRSGLVPICSKSGTTELQECLGTASSGGSLVYADNQMTQCVIRSKARAGLNYGWWNEGRTPYPGQSFLYSNCDTMVLTKVLGLHRSEDYLKWAQDSLFSKIGMNASWWKDNSQPQGGNVLGYCCIDATPRDFARLGELVLNRGIALNQQIVSRAYVDAIVQASATPGTQYASQFWINTDHVGRRFITASGFDGQMVAVDVSRNLIIVRMGLYNPIFNASNGRVMRLKAGDPGNSNWIGSLPQAMAADYSASYNEREILTLVSQSVTAP